MRVACETRRASEEDYRIERARQAPGGRRGAGRSSSRYMTAAPPFRHRGLIHCLFVPTPSRLSPAGLVIMLSGHDASRCAGEDERDLSNSSVLPIRFPGLGIPL